MAISLYVYTMHVTKVIAPDKTFFFFFHQKVLVFFLFLHKNICCGYSLEAPFQGASNEYNNICFCGEIRKILCGLPLLSGAMQGVCEIMKIFHFFCTPSLHCFNNNINPLKKKVLIFITSNTIETIVKN